MGERDWDKRYMEKGGRRSNVYDSNNVTDLSVEIRRSRLGVGVAGGTYQIVQKKHIKHKKAEVAEMTYLIDPKISERNVERKKKKRMSFYNNR